MLFKILGDFRNFVQERARQVLTIFNLGKSKSYDLGDDSFKDGDSFISQLFEHNDKISDKVLSGGIRRK